MDEKINNEVKKIPLKELIDVANKFIKGELNKEELDDYGRTLIIRGYIPILDKTAIVMNLLTQHMYSDTSTQEIKIAELYRNLFFKVLLEEYAYVDCSEEELCNYDNYDLLNPIFENYILSFCQNDYDQIKEFIKDALNMYNINDMTQALYSVDLNELKKASYENKQMLDSLQKNTELIRELNNVVAINDPLVNEIAQQVVKNNL